MKIAFLDRETLGNFDTHRFVELVGSAVFCGLCDSKYEILEVAEDADIIVTNKVVIDKELMDKLKNLKFIQIAATGMNNVDLEYAKKKGIIVKNVVGYSTKSVVQHTFALVLGLLNKICYFDKYTREEYPRSDIFTHIQNWFEISGKRWGIIGLGTIGKEVAKIAESFGAEVVYYSTSGKNNDKTYKRVELEELMKTSDIISIHAPLNENTKNLIGYNELMMMKDGGVIVNLGRGGIINEKDLVKVLKEKDIFVGLDVFEREPVKFKDPLLEFKDKTLLTPHVAWTSMEARKTLIDEIYRNVEEFIKQSGS
jgi:glycerate dehydrogenase